MNARKQLRVVCSAVVALIVVTAPSCGEKSTVAVGPYKKVVLYPKKGDTIQFSGFTATFRGPSPCANGNAGLSDCKIKIDTAAHYRFDCDKPATCLDPEVEVGSIGIQNIAPGIPPPDTVVVMWCEQGAIHLEPADAQVPTGKEIAWENNGSGSEVLPDWNITFTPIPTPPTRASFCADTSKSITKDHPYCSVGGPLKYTYNVKANPSTSCHDATGTVTITPNP